MVGAWCLLSERMKNISYCCLLVLGCPYPFLVGKGDRKCFPAPSRMCPPYQRFYKLAYTLSWRIVFLSWERLSLSNPFAALEEWICTWNDEGEKHPPSQEINGSNLVHKRGVSCGSQATLTPNSASLEVNFIGLKFPRGRWSTFDGGCRGRHLLDWQTGDSRTLMYMSVTWMSLKACVPIQYVWGRAYFCISDKL